METKDKAPKTIDEYISLYPPKVRAKLERLRKVIRKAAPGAEEKISYGMPAFLLNGPLLYFAAFERHIGLYALPAAMVAFKERLSRYKSGKGSVQFPLDEELPYELIGEIARFRVEENEKKAAGKKKANS
jgi:uncharacterized protein YdhG (YjbR/CyaY superfamily)